MNDVKSMSVEEAMAAARNIRPTEIADSVNVGVISKNASVNLDPSILAELDDKKAELIQKTAGISMTNTPRYPSSILSLSDLELPERVVDLFKWCKYFYMFDPLISGAINALATFPITPIALEESEDHLKRKELDADEKQIYEFEDSDDMRAVKYNLFQVINIYKLLIEIGIDYFLYGNCFVYGEIEEGSVEGDYNWKFIQRIPPQKIYIDTDFNGRPTYKWNISDRIRRIVEKKSPKAAYDSIPETVREAVKKSKAVVIKGSNIYHFARPSDSYFETSWGTPVVANVLKLIMYRNTLRQAQEAVAREHIVPLRIFYMIPPTNGAVTDQNVAGNFAGELKKWVSDPNYKIVAPMPVNVITAGGQGRSLLLGPEIEACQAEILAGMNVPREFIFGGVSYSGSSISLRILENHFITYRLLQEDFICNFLIKGLLKARGTWRSSKDDKSLIRASFGELKMQDDAQQKQLYIGLNASGKISDEELYNYLGIDAQKMRASIHKETERLQREQLKMKENEVVGSSKLNRIQILEAYKNQLFEARLKKVFEVGGMNEIEGKDLDEVEKILEKIDVTPEEQAMTPTAQSGQTGLAPMVDPAMAGADPNAPPAEGAEPQQEQPVPEGGAPAGANPDMQSAAISVLKAGSVAAMVQMIQVMASRSGPDIASNIVGIVVDYAPQMLAPEELSELGSELVNLGFPEGESLIQSAPSPEQQEGVDMRPMPEQLPPRRY